MSLESQLGYTRSLKIFFNHFQKNVIFRLSALGQPKAGLIPDMATGLRPALGWPKAGLHFGKAAFENSKNAFFQKIKMVYAKSALTMLFGMLFLL